jgi:hypothetical protein
MARWAAGHRIERRKPLRVQAVRPMETIMAELKAKTRNKLPKKDFAEPDKRAYPIEDKPHARNAKARASQAVKAGRMSKAEQAKIDQKADQVLNKSS